MYFSYVHYGIVQNSVLDTAVISFLTSQGHPIKLISIGVTLTTLLTVGTNNQTW